MSNTQVITIDSITIKQDFEGRYCLNDLHKAAEKYALVKDIRPNEWLSLQSTKELIAVLNTENPVVTPVVAKPGRYGGTYVVKPLVYAYAMWISAAFHLKVIEFFDRGQTQGVAVADHAAVDVRKNPLKYMRVLLEQAEALEAELAIAAPKAAVFDAVVADKRVTVAAFAHQLSEISRSNYEQHHHPQLQRYGLPVPRGWLLQHDQSGCQVWEGCA